MYIYIYIYIWRGSYEFIHVHVHQLIVMKMVVHDFELLVDLFCVVCLFVCTCMLLVLVTH